MNPVSGNYASAFRDTKDQNNNNKYFGWGYCKNCFCLQNVPQEITYFPTRYHQWVKYSEPDWHFESILSKIKYLKNNDHGFHYVLGLSYKDTSLVKLISKELNIRGQPSDIIGITNDWLKIGLDESKEILSDHIKSTSKGKKSILIARRVLDHCAFPTELLEVFNCMGKGSLIYIEINDYYHLVNNNKYDFLWNERTFYPFKWHMAEIIKKTNLGLLEIGSIYDKKDESIVYSFLNVIGDNIKHKENQSVMITDSYSMPCSRPNTNAPKRFMRKHCPW